MRNVNFTPMAKCDPFTYQGITPQTFQAVTRQLADKGFALSGPQGTVTGPFGIVLDYDWNEQSGELVIQVKEKSFFVSCNQIREQLSNALQQYNS